MKSAMNVRAVGAVVALVLACGTPVFAAVVVDNFDAGNVVYSGPNNSSEAALGANTLGGTRDTDVDIAGAQLEINDAPGIDTTGRLAFSNNFGVAATLTLTYDALGVDLTNAGADNAIGFLFLSSDQPATLTVKITDGLANTFTVITGVGTGLSLQIDVLYSSFIGVDVTDTDQVVVTLTPNNELGGDYFLDLIESTSSDIPTPAALPMGAAALALAALRRRRR